MSNDLKNENIFSFHITTFLLINQSESSIIDMSKMVRKLKAENVFEIFAFDGVAELMRCFHYLAPFQRNKVAQAHQLFLLKIEVSPHNTGCLRLHC